jgi:hypothetical protein
MMDFVNINKDNLQAMHVVLGALESMQSYINDIKELQQQFKDVE